MTPKTQSDIDKQSLRAKLRAEFPRNRSQLLPALHFLQRHFGYLPDWGMEVVGWHLGIPASEVYGAATSYTEFRIEQPGTHLARVCTGLSCMSSGAQELLEFLESKLGIRAGNLATDHRVMLEQVPCGFLCGVAPAVQIDGVWRGRVTSESLRKFAKKTGRS